MNATNISSLKVTGQIKKWLRLIFNLFLGSCLPSLYNECPCWSLTQIKKNPFQCNETTVIGLIFLHWNIELKENKVINRYRRKSPKVDASISDVALSHTRGSDASKKKTENTRVHFWTFSPVDKFRVLACIG